MDKQKNIEHDVQGRAVPPLPGWYILGVLSLLMGFGSISTDLYLPAMPAMGRA
jgi:DHA1 family bicyclomycin/chloramphenicol resistance-like MFS transporter